MVAAAVERLIAKQGRRLDWRRWGLRLQPGAAAEEVVEGGLSARAPGRADLDRDGGCGNTRGEKTGQEGSP